MADENEDPAFRERPELYCQLFVLCRTVWYDVDRPEQGYSLGRVMLDVAPEVGNGFPLQLARLFGYVQLHGDPGDYSVRVRLVTADQDEEGDDLEQSLGEGAEYGPWPIQVFGDDFVNQYGFPLRNVILPEPGQYEFQLWQDADEGEDRLLFRVRVQAKERT